MNTATTAVIVLFLLALVGLGVRADLGECEQVQQDCHDYGPVYDPTTGCPTSECQTSPCPGITLQSCPSQRRVIDANGCQTGTCFPPHDKPKQKLPLCGPVTLQLCSHGRVYDLETGCETSQCQLGRCPPITYQLCESGRRRVDTNGCQTSVCIPAQDVCPSISMTDQYCIFGREVDEYGCTTNICKPEPECPGVTKQLCFNGRVYSLDGCMTSSCQENPCADIDDRFCPGGFRKIDENGCRMDECLY